MCSAQLCTYVVSHWNCDLPSPDFQPYILSDLLPMLLALQGKKRLDPKTTTSFRKEDRKTIMVANDSMKHWEQKGH